MYIYSDHWPFTPTWGVVTVSTSSYLKLCSFNGGNLDTLYKYWGWLLKVNPHFNFPLSRYWPYIMAYKFCNPPINFHVCMIYWSYIVLRKVVQPDGMLQMWGVQMWKKPEAVPGQTSFIGEVINNGGESWHINNFNTVILSEILITKENIPNIYGSSGQKTLVRYTITLLHTV